MSERASVRFIAKQRLKAMGVPHYNHIFGLGLSHTKAQNLQRTRRGRVILERLRSAHEPVLRRVTTGSLAKEGFRAQMGQTRRKYRVAR